MAKKPTVKRTSRDSDQSALRLPSGMRKQVKRLAAREGHSMNAVIVTALAEYLEHEDAPKVLIGASHAEPAFRLDARITDLANQMGLLAHQHQELVRLIKKGGA